MCLKGWKFDKICILCYPFAFWHRLFVPTPLKCQLFYLLFWFVSLNAIYMSNVWWLIWRIYHLKFLFPISSKVILVTFHHQTFEQISKSKFQWMSVLYTIPEDDYLEPKKRPLDLFVVIFYLFPRKLAKIFPLHHS